MSLGKLLADGDPDRPAPPLSLDDLLLKAVEPDGIRETWFFA